MADPFETSAEVAKASKEVAKTVGQVVGAAQQLGSFIAKYVGGPLTQASGMIEDKLAYMRWDNQLDLMVKANKKLTALGLSEPTRSVPLKFAIPLLQAASLEDDEGIRDLWANLLVNAANADSGMDLRRTYISILESITPFEAKLLQKIYSLPFDAAKNLGVFTGYLPDDVCLATVMIDKEAKLPKPNEEVMLSLANLSQLGCITVGQLHGGSQSFDRIVTTLLGKSMMAACSLHDPSGHQP